MNPDATLKSEARSVPGFPAGRNQRTEPLEADASNAPAGSTIHSGR